MLRAPTTIPSSKVLLMRLSDSSCQLRVRRSGHDASVLLRTPEGATFDCVRAKQYRQKRYTQQNWAEEYKALYVSFDNGDPEVEDRYMKMIEEKNSDETRCTFQKNRVTDPELDFITEIKYCALVDEDQDDFTVLHSKWDPTHAVLELLVSKDFAQGEVDIACTYYTSMLLFFEPVVFEEDNEGAPAGLKRARSDDEGVSE
jgi:hypothetical protein